MRKLILTFLILALLCGFGAAPARASAQAPISSTAVPDPKPIPESYALMAENAAFKLFADQTTLAFVVLDKRSGYIWHSGLTETKPEDRLNKSWAAFAKSGVSIEYLDEKAVNKRISVTNSKTSIQFTATGQGFDAAVTFTEFGITVPLVVTLEEQGVSVDVPFERIQQDDAKFKLGLLYLYPFMGATREAETPGYMFIPDGVGSLIQFQATTKAKNMFYGRYYGKDLGMIAEMPWDPNTRDAFKISVPVIGMVHGEKQNGYLAIVEKGASYGEIQAHPSGVITKWNFIYNAFVYNEAYFQATNKSGAGVTTIQPKTNAFDIRMHYRFLTGSESDYVGMARSYQQYLLDQGMLQKAAASGSDIGVRLEVLGGEKEKVLLWWRAISMTTVQQVDDMVSSLAVKNPEVIYYGWQPLGASSMFPGRLKLDSRLGSTEQLRALAEKIHAAGGHFSLYLDPQAAYAGEKGYSTRFDLAMAITDVNLLAFNRWMVNYFLNLDTLGKRYAALSDQVFKEIGGGLALDGIGTQLFSDFKPGHELNREQAIAQYQALLAAHPGRTGFYAPNDYAFGAMSAYYEMPISTSGYIFASGDVPFLPIVLAGYVPSYGPALNFSSSIRDDRLKLADYGVYPSFYLTQEVTARILLTPSNWIFTSSIDQWKGEIEQTYAWLNNLLGPVTGQPIVARQALAAGVYATTYANGKSVIVNYTDRPFTAGSVAVNAKDAVLTDTVIEVLP